MEDNGENPDLAGGAPYYWKDALINMDELRRTFVAKEGDTMSGKLTIASSSGYQLELKDDGDNVNLLTFTDQKGASEGYLGIDNTRADFVMRNDRANAEMRIKSTEVTYSVSGMTAALLRTGDITGSAWRNPRSSSLKDYIDTAVSSIDLTDYVKKSGDTMTGPLTIAPHSKPLVLQHWGTGTAVNWTSDIDTVQAYVGYPDASTARFEISSQGTTLSLSDGRIDASTHFMCNGEVYAGESYMTRNGNIYGNVWREFGNATNARDAVRWVYES